MAVSFLVLCFLMGLGGGTSPTVPQSGKSTHASVSISCLCRWLGVKFPLLSQWLENL